MRVVLPSTGVLGTRSVDLRQVTFKDLRAMSSMSDENDLCEIELVKSLLAPDTDFNKITYYDFKYIFNITIFSVLSNILSFESTCTVCGKTHSFQFDVTDCQVHQLDGFKKPVTHKIGNTEYTFRLLSAQQHFDAVEYSKTCDDEEAGYNDAIASYILFGDIDHASTMSEIDAKAYLATMLFHRISFHGIELVKLLECPSCKAFFPSKLSVSPELIRIEISKIMDIYANVNMHLTFDDFCAMNIPEFESFVCALTKDTPN